MILDSSRITGPSEYYGIVGNPSPAAPSNLQVVEPQQASFGATLWNATKAVFGTFSFGATNIAVAKATTGIAAGVQNVGQAVNKAATSASRGITIGFILLILVGGIILLGNLRRATG